MQFTIFAPENEPIVSLAKQAEKLRLGLQLRELQSRAYEQLVFCNRIAAPALAQQEIPASAQACRRRYGLAHRAPGDTSLTVQARCGRGYTAIATTTPSINPAPHNHPRAPPHGHAWPTR